MIEFFRKAADTWAARIFLLLLALIFIFLWGGQEGLRMIGLSKDSTVATVGNKKITTQELSSAIVRAAAMIQWNTGQRLTNKDIERLGLDRQVLDLLIVDYLIQAEATHLGISVSDEMVAKMIKSQPTFQTPDGKFSKDLFDRFLNMMGFTHERDYVAYLKRDMLKRRVIATLIGTASVPAVAIDPLYAWNEQTRSAQGMVIDPAQLTVKKTLSDDDLRDYYGKNRQNFTQPERRTFEALLIDTQPYEKLARSEIKDEDINALYAIEQTKKYKDIPEAKAKAEIRAQLKTDFIREKTLETGRSIQEDFDAGLSLEELEKKYAAQLFKYVDTRLSNPEIKKDPLQEQMTNLAFQIDENILSSTEEAELSDGNHRYFLLKVSQVKPKEILNFNEAQPLVKDALQKNLQLSAAEALVREINEQLSAGELFDQIAAKHNLKLVKINANRQEALAPTPYKLNSFALANLFGVRSGQAALLAVQDNTGQPIFIIAKITKIENGTATKDTEKVEQFSAALTEQLQLDVAEIYVTYLRQKYPVEVKEKFFAY
jgi:peptidyl-prolyl cis-trans isomerase D